MAQQGVKRKQKYHLDGNGMKCHSSNPELIPMSSNSFHGSREHHYHSPKAPIKRSRLFFCCSKKGVKNRRGGGATQGGSARYEREHIFEVRK